MNSDFDRIKGFTQYFIGISAFSLMSLTRVSMGIQNFMAFNLDSSITRLSLVRWLWPLLTGFYVSIFWMIQNMIETGLQGSILAGMGLGSVLLGYYHLIVIEKQKVSDSTHPRSMGLNTVLFIMSKSKEKPATSAHSNKVEWVFWSTTATVAFLVGFNVLGFFITLGTIGLTIKVITLREFVRDREFTQHESRLNDQKGQLFISGQEKGGDPIKKKRNDGQTVIEKEIHQAELI